MTDQIDPDRNGKSKPARAGGFFIMLAMIIGIVVGIATGQISAGMIGGLTVGAGIAALIWLFERRS